MQRDVKVGLVLGVLLVAVVAVVFFRRDDDDRDKFTKLLPAPDAVADRARDMLGPSPSDPYPVAPEYLADSWQSPKSKSARIPTPQRNKNGEATAQIDSLDGSGNERARPGSSVSAVLEQPEFDPPRPGSRSKSELLGARARLSSPDGSIRGGNGEYTIQEGDTLSEIARKRLGSAALWMQLYEANKDVLRDPANIPAGQRIRIPATSWPDRTADRSAAQTASNQPGSTITSPRSVRSVPRGDLAKTSSSSSGGSYLVKDGDTLVDIAREKYGRDSMYLEILRANEDQIKSPGEIHPGMVLRLPHLP
jgi:nucleoid-associated protein YgaU